MLICSPQAALFFYLLNNLAALEQYIQSTMLRTRKENAGKNGRKSPLMRSGPPTAPAHLSSYLNK